MSISNIISYCQALAFNSGKELKVRSTHVKLAPTMSRLDVRILKRVPLAETPIRLFFQCPVLDCESIVMVICCDVINVTKNAFQCFIATLLLNQKNY